MSQPAKARSGKPRPQNRQSDGFFARMFGGLRAFFLSIPRFYRQVVAELRKTVRPTKTELWTFFTVVLFFVIAVMIYVGALDFLFGKFVMLLYGA